jgi:hypothetical protein
MKNILNAEAIDSIAKSRREPSSHSTDGNQFQALVMQSCSKLGGAVSRILTTLEALQDHANALAFRPLFV